MLRDRVRLALMLRSSGLLWRSVAGSLFSCAYFSLEWQLPS